MQLTLFSTILYARNWLKPVVHLGLGGSDAEKNSPHSSQKRQSPKSSTEEVEAELAAKTEADDK